MNRRSFLQLTAGAGVASAAGSMNAEAAEPAVAAKTYQGGVSQWPLCINTSTIRPTPLEDKIRVAAKAGYDGIEPWINELEEYEKGGGSLRDLGAEIRDLGMFVPNIIGLWNSMPATVEEWEQSLPVTRERMRRCAEVGSQHVAVIPTPDREDFDLKWAADRYRDLIKIGRDDYNIVAGFEFVGFLKGVHRLGQASAIALDADDPDACLIADTFHLYRGGSGFEGIGHLAGSFIGIFHWNDVPASPPRSELQDSDRIYPGDGILPLRRALELLRRIDYRGALSLEMFNRAHWEQDPEVVAKTGLEKMLALMV